MNPRPVHTSWEDEDHGPNVEWGEEEFLWLKTRTALPTQLFQILKHTGADDINADTAGMLRLIEDENIDGMKAVSTSI